MDWLLYVLARAVILLLQALPLRVVARLGRICGGLAYWVDARHRRVATRNLARCLGDTLPPRDIARVARENFRRIGEGFACLVKTASMTRDQLKPHLAATDLDSSVIPGLKGSSSRLVAAIGHFGNFEIYARVAQWIPGLKAATTYRGLPSPALNRLLQSLRQQSGCLFFERRTDARALKAAMAEGGIIVGLLADQHAGDRGLPLPFFGRICSTSAAPALFALRYNAPLIVPICYRVGLAQWRIEWGSPVPTQTPDGAPLSAMEIMAEVNRRYEAAIRRDPANWFWVHNRWKDGKHRKPRPVSSSGATPAPQDADPLGLDAR
jgi:KDO2-lipid IV(A) lauroyltransferase